MNRDKKIIALGASACAISILLLLAYIIIGAPFGSTSVAVLCCTILILLITILVMIFLLRSYLHITLFAYRNICLIGGILFLTILAAVLVGFFCRMIFIGKLTMTDVYQAIIRFPRLFSFYALMVIVFISLLVGISNVVLIRREGFCLNNVLSLIVAGFYIGGAMLVFFVSDFISEKWFVGNAFLNVLRTVIPLFLFLMLCYLECILAGTAIMGWKAAHHRASYDKDYIIILGCSIDKRGGLLPLLKGRVNSAVRFAWDQEIHSGVQAKYVPSGGKGPNEIMSEGSAMEFYLLTHGAEGYEVFPEKKSANTWENICFSKRIIEEKKPDAKIAIATTNYHILRSGILAREAGLNVEAIAGDTKWYFWPNGFIREFFGILKLKIKTHIIFASAVAAICFLIGLIGYWAKLL